MKIRKFFESHEDNISLIGEIFDELSDNLNVQVKISSFNLYSEGEVIDLCSTLLDRRPSDLRISRSMINPIVSIFEECLYVININCSQGFDHFKSSENLIKRFNLYHKDGELSFLMKRRNKYDINSLRIFFIRNRERVTECVAEIMNGKTYESIDHQDINLQILRDIFLDISDETEISIKSSSIGNDPILRDFILRKILSRRQLIRLEGWISKLAVDIIRHKEFNSKISSIINDSTYQLDILVHPHLIKDVKNIISHSERYAGYTVIITEDMFSKGKSKEIRYFLMKDISDVAEKIISIPEKDVIINESNSHSDLDNLRDIFSEVEDTREVMIKEGIDNSSYYICCIILPPKYRDVLRRMWVITEGFFEFCDSLLKDKTFTVTVNHLTNDEYAKICLRAEKYLNISGIDRVIDYIGPKRYQSISFLKDEKEIVKKILNEIQKNSSHEN